MQNTVPAARVAQAAHISASVERFLNGGGKIKRIAIGVSANVDPMHRGRAPDYEERKAAAYKARTESSKTLLWRAKWGDDVIRLFDSGKNIKDIEAELGQPRNLITACVKESGRNPAANKYPQPPAELVEQIRAMAADRYSGRYTATILGLERERVYTIAKKHGIHFVSRDSHKP